MTLTDRQRAAYQELRSEQKHLYDREGDWYRSSADTNVARTWELYGWVAPSVQREERKAA